jgi:hypothetical protein
MTRGNFALILVAAISAGISATSAHAQPFLVIPTNFGTGADAEVRESQNGADLGGFVAGSNRGANDELATRLSARTIIDNMDGTFTAEVSGNQSSAMYMKFDISELPGSADPYWIGKQVDFRGYTRNASNFRAYRPDRDGVSQPFELRLRALDPNGTYSTSQTDQSGNAYTASHYEYDWDEGDNSAGSGITAFDAPGRIPFCVDSNLCDINATLGEFDEFDVDPNVLDIGLATMPHMSVGNDLPQRYPINYTDESGNLTDIVKAARDLGLNHVTLIAHNGFDLSDVNDPDAFFSHNHLLAPKEKTTIITAEMDDNIDGAFSPQLRVVPEPSSLIMITLVSLAGLVARRRRK